MEREVYTVGRIVIIHPVDHGHERWMVFEDIVGKWDGHDDSRWGRAQ
jgi:hypothetical protein